jgi:hypothetical protein
VRPGYQHGLALADHAHNIAHRGATEPILKT